jgi:hypothetical protein
VEALDSEAFELHEVDCCNGIGTRSWGNPDAQGATIQVRYGVASEPCGVYRGVKFVCIIANAKKDTDPVFGCYHKLYGAGLSGLVNPCITQPSTVHQIFSSNTETHDCNTPVNWSFTFPSYSAAVNIGNDGCVGSKNESGTFNIAGVAETITVVGV